MNPNNLIARATSRISTSSNLSTDNIALHEYVDWAVEAYPEALILVVNSRKAMPEVRGHKILRGDRQRSTGWCVIESRQFEGAILIVRKEFLRDRKS